MARPPKPITLTDARLAELYLKWVQGNGYSIANGRSDFLADAENAELTEAFVGARRWTRYHTGRKVLPKDFVLGPLPKGARVFRGVNHQDCGEKDVPGLGRMVVITYDLVELDPALVAKGQSLSLASVELARIVPDGKGTFDAYHLPTLNMGSFSSVIGLYPGAPDIATAAKYVSEIIAPQVNQPRNYY
jgi:hypothetical protein